MTTKRKPKTHADPKRNGGFAPSASVSDDVLSHLDEIIRMVGDAPEITRFPTGLPYLEWAIGGQWPIRIMAEIYGWPKSFKSTTAEYLAGRAAVTLKGSMVLLEFEHMQPSQVQLNILPSGFRGEVYNEPATVEKASEVVPLGDEERIRAFRARMLLPENAAGIIDPIGAYIPTAEEEEKSMDEVHMGVWAKHTAKYARAQVKDLRVSDHPFSIFLVDHMSAAMQGEADSPGKRWKHSCGIRLVLHKWYKPADGKAKSGELKDGSWIVGAEVKANKFGPEGREFSFVVKAGRGVHVGLSAVHACVMNGLVTVGKTGHIAIEDKTFGTFNQMCEKWRDDDLFAPFYALAENWASKQLELSRGSV